MAARCPDSVTWWTDREGLRWLLGITEVGPEGVTRHVAELTRDEAEYIANGILARIAETR